MNLNLGPVETNLNHAIRKNGCLFIVLLDPDSQPVDEIVSSGIQAAQGGADALFLGGSFIGNPLFSKLAVELKKETSLPVILFPGGSSHVVPGPDAILFTSLISGRNPQYLIDEQVKGAVLVHGLKLEALPTGYMLIDSGKMTAVEYISNTKPMPNDKPEIAVAHSLAAQLMGLRWLYLEAGSGAKNPVPLEMVRAVGMTSSLNLIVGGGIKTPQAASDRAQAGAKAIVIGNFFEEKQKKGIFKEFANAIHFP